MLKKKKGIDIWNIITWLGKAFSWTLWLQLLCCAVLELGANAQQRWRQHFSAFPGTSAASWGWAACVCARDAHTITHAESISLPEHCLWCAFTCVELSGCFSTRKAQVWVAGGWASQGLPYREHQPNPQKVVLNRCECDARWLCDSFFCFDSPFLAVVTV